MISRCMLYYQASPNFPNDPMMPVYKVEKGGPNPIFDNEFEALTRGLQVIADRCVKWELRFIDKAQT